MVRYVLRRWFSPSTRRSSFMGPLLRSLFGGETIGPRSKLCGEVLTIYSTECSVSSNTAGRVPLCRHL